ncbi:hypothetical protein [Aquabacterium humicola]|uniref:hypothetical protein n=1 Tax=Aquabacterium humicola TaxID=3237377 RepID=UPI002543C632|nr:hypothetical protein [Rubrivivax pictus]
MWSTAAAATVAVLDLRIIASLLFPAIATLSSWPQFADHLMWGACLGGTLHWLVRRRAIEERRNQAAKIRFRRAHHALPHR